MNERDDDGRYRADHAGAVARGDRPAFKSSDWLFGARGPRGQAALLLRAALRAHHLNADSAERFVAGSRAALAAFGAVREVVSVDAARAASLAASRRGAERLAQPALAYVGAPDVALVLSEPFHGPLERWHVTRVADDEAMLDSGIEPATLCYLLLYDRDTAPDEIVGAVSGEWSRSYAVLRARRATAFWAEWYDGIIDGRHLGDDTLAAIVGIDDTVWEAGPDAVADAARRWPADRERRAVARDEGLEAIADAVRVIVGEREVAPRARAALLALDVAAPVVGIGHNRPPEPIEDAPLAPEDFIRLRAALLQLEAQATRPAPEPAAAKAAAATVRSVLGALLGWLGGKVDTGAEAFAKALGTGMAVAASGTVVAHTTNLVAALEPLVEAVARWLALL